MTRPADKNPQNAVFACLLLWMVCMLWSPVFASTSLSYNLAVTIDPAAGTLHADATLLTGSPVRRVEFILNAGVHAAAPEGKLTRLRTSGDGVRSAYRLELPEPSTTFRVEYGGRPASPARVTMGGMPTGYIDDQGVYLDGASAWYPVVEGRIDRVRLAVKLPEGWQSISIGKRGEKAGVQTWTTEVPHDDIYLLAGRYHRHARDHRGIDLSVWLLDDDADLAARYLALAGDYIDHYQALVGPYPFAKFAVVANRWQTGFGMPSFTLLGSRVMRLPFIPFTSLPHEILHNWWGNGVWVDYAAGNWSEGLTAYLSDHWMDERRGDGASYRLKALQRYSNFAADGEDMPLVRFVSRHNDASQSVGYGKSLMLFHMIRVALGDEAFEAGLRRVWERHRFTTVGFETVLRTLTEDDPALTAYALAWLHRTGAPRLSLGDTVVSETADGYTLHATIDQRNAVAGLQVPVAVQLAGEDTARVATITLDGERTTARLQFPGRPLRIDVDPAYDVLRYLDPSEQPPALNRLLGAPTLLVLPSAADGDMREAWRSLADQWQRRYPQLEVGFDADLAAWPSGRNVIVAGWDNRLHDAASVRVARLDQALDRNGLRIHGEAFAAEDYAAVLVNSDVDGATTGFVGAATPRDVATLARKLPHYGSYGRLLFDAASGENRRKDTLTSAHAALSRQLAAEPVALRLPQRPVLGDRARPVARR